MSLQSPLAYPIPEQTSLVAHAAFPKGNPYMRMRDTLGPIFTNPDFAALFPKLGHPAEAGHALAVGLLLGGIFTVLSLALGRMFGKYASVVEIAENAPSAEATLRRSRTARRNSAGNRD